MINLRVLAAVALLAAVSVRADVRPYGAWGIFGTENDIDTPTDAWWGSGYLRGTLITMDWVEVQPTAPTNLTNLADPENFNWTKLDQALTKVKNGNLPYVSFLFFHGNKAPTWIYGNQLADHNGDGELNDCPTLTGSSVTDWGDWNPGNLRKPSYDATDMPDRGTGLGTGHTTPPGGTDGIVPVIGCSTTEPVARAIKGNWPDYLDKDYEAFFGAFIQAVVAHIKEEQEPGGRLAGAKVSYYQAAAGRSGDDVVIPRNNATVTYEDYDAYSAARAYYPHDYMGGNLPEKDVPTRWWTGRVWDLWIDALGVMGATPHADLMVNLPPRLQNPAEGFTTMYEDLLARHSGIDATRIVVKAADFAQGEGLAYLNDTIDGVAYLLDAPGPRVIRGEFDESYKGTTVAFDANWATGGDGRYVNDRPEQELWWQILQAVHFGISAPNWMTHGQFRARYLAGDVHGDEFLASFLWLNDHSGYKYPKIQDNRVLQDASATDTPATAPYAWIAFREQPRFLDDAYRPWSGAARSNDASWTALYNAVKPRGALADLETLAHGSDQHEKFGFWCKSTTHLSYDGYDGNFNAYVTESNVDLPIANRDTRGWWDQGPISQRFGKYAKGFNTGKSTITLNVDNRWVIAGRGVKATVTYLDRAGDSWALKYTNGAGAPISLRTITGVMSGKGQWKQAVFDLAGMKPSSAADVMLTKVAGDPLFHLVELERTTGTPADTTAPVIGEIAPIATPGAAASPSYQFTSSESGGLALSGGCASATTAATAGANTITLSALTDGTHVCALTVTDAAGNASAPMAMTPFVTDTTSPAITITAPTKVYSAAITDTTVRVTDALGVLAAEVALSPDSTASPDTFVCLQTSATRVDCTLRVPGSGSVIVEAADTVGNATAKTESGYSITLDVTPPRVQSVAAASGAYGDGATVPLTVTFTEPVTSSGVTVTLETGATDRTCVFTVTNDLDAICSYRVRAGDVSPDLTTTSIVGPITDAAGNSIVNRNPIQSLASTSAVVIDTVDPVVSEVVAVASSVSGSALNWSFTSSEAGNLTFSGPCSSLRNRAASGSNTVTFDALPVGTYGTCQATVTDAAGNAGSVAISPFSVTAPLDELHAPENFALVQSWTQCKLTWSYQSSWQEAIDGFEVELNGVPTLKLSRGLRSVPCRSVSSPSGPSHVRIRAYGKGKASWYTKTVSFEMT